MREAIRKVMMVMFLSGLIMFVRSGEVNATDSSKLRVGIYMNNSDGGVTYGYKGVMGTLKNLKGMECEYVIDLNLKDLTNYDVLIIPDIKQMGNEPFDWMESLRSYVVNLGGCVMLYHDSVGYVRSPFSQENIFPEICGGASGREFSFDVVVKAKHLITKKYQVGQRLKHTYRDHILLRKGEKGKVLYTDANGNPLLIVGDIGKGRVIFNGMIVYSNSDCECEHAEGIDEEILLSSIKWFSEKGGLETKAVADVKRKTGAELKKIKIPEIVIFPTPRRYRFGPKEVYLMKDRSPAALLIVGEGNSRKDLLAAEEIINRCKSLSGITLKIRKDNEVSKEELKNYNLILIGNQNNNKISQIYITKNRYKINQNEPGEQGYIIKYFRNEYGKDCILLAGSDSQGTLYASYSFIQLLRTKGKDSVYAIEADVWDKPGIRYRGFFERLGEEPTLADRLNKIDRMARMKINMVRPGMGGAGEDKQLNLYAKDRGLRLDVVYMWDLGFTQPTHLCMTPELSAYCWSDEVLMKKRVDKLKRLAREIKPGGYYLHAIDYLMDDLWPLRCEECKRRFKDRSEADAHMINSFYQAIRSEDKDAVINMVILPYQAVPQNDKKLQGYLTKLGSLIPDDIQIVLRENTEEAITAYKNCLKQPIYLYEKAWGCDWQGTWLPSFTGVVKYKDMAETYYYATPWINLQALSLAGVAEYAWNPDLPKDAKYLHTNFVPRACKFLYGDAAAYMAEFLLMDIKVNKTKNAWDVIYLQKEVAKVTETLELLEKAENSVSDEGRKSVEFFSQIFHKLYYIAKVRLESAKAKLELEEARKDIILRKYQQALIKLKKGKKILSNVDEQFLRKATKKERLQARYLKEDISEWMKEMEKYGKVMAKARAPLWAIGKFDNSEKEFPYNFPGGKTNDFKIGEDERRFPLRTMYGLKIRFNADLSKGGRFLIGHRVFHNYGCGGGMFISIDGKEAGFIYDEPLSFTTSSIRIPPVDGEEHTLSLSVLPAEPIGSLTPPNAVVVFDALEFYPGMERLELVD